MEKQSIDYTKYVKSAHTAMDYTAEPGSYQVDINAHTDYSMHFPGMKHNGNTVMIKLRTGEKSGLKLEGIDVSEEIPSRSYHRWAAYERVCDEADNKKGKWVRLPDDAKIDVIEGREYSDIVKNLDDNVKEMAEQLRDCSYVMSYREVKDIIKASSKDNTIATATAVRPSLSDEEYAEFTKSVLTPEFEHETEASAKIAFAEHCESMKQFIYTGSRTIVGPINTIEQIDSKYGDAIKEGTRLYQLKSLGADVANMVQPSAETDVSFDLDDV